jgi:hypothetical protein
MELHRLTADARKWVKELWDAAEEASQQPGLLSPLASAVQTAIAESYAASEDLEGQNVHDALGVVMRIGYATRAAVAVPTDQPILTARAFGLDRAPETKPTADSPQAAEQLLDPVRGIADEEFDSAMTLPEPVWFAYVSTATRELQRGLGSSLVSWRDLSRERVEELLRYGYVLRCLDEALSGTSRTRRR